MPESAAALVQRQLDAYNAKDVQAWLATYAEDAVHYALHGAVLAQGYAQLCARITARFAEPDLYARLLSRTLMHEVVVDHEEITRNFPEGPAVVEMICIYEIAQGLIHKASFALGPKRALCAG